MQILLEKKNGYEGEGCNMIRIKLSNQSDFELAHIFECGQCFRWKKEDDGSYVGVIKNGVILTIQQYYMLLWK